MPADAPILSLRGVTKRYGSVTALDDLTVDIPAGRTGFVGANGAGKSTSFRLILGLAAPTSGAIDVDGRPVADDPIGVRSRLGYMPEHDCLPLDQSAADIVATFGELSGLPRRDARQRASDICDLVGLDEARFRPVGGYSTGMRQRTKLAQALVADPQLVLLDEPTAGLDPLGRSEMLALVARLGDFGISVLMATHLLDDVQQVCDYVVMIDAGRLVVAGNTDALLERSGTVTIDVGPSTALPAPGQTSGASSPHPLVAVLTASGLTIAAADEHRGVFDIETRSDDDLDAIRDAVATAGLPLFRMSSRLSSLDDVFVTQATR